MLCGALRGALLHLNLLVSIVVGARGAAHGHEPGERLRHGPGGRVLVALPYSQGSLLLVIVAAH